MWQYPDPNPARRDLDPALRLGSYWCAECHGVSATDVSATDTGTVRIQDGSIG